MKIVNKILLSLLATAILSSTSASALTWKEVKEFGHKHRTKILIGTGVVVTAVAVVAGVLVWKHYYKGAPATGISIEPREPTVDTSSPVLTPLSAAVTKAANGLVSESEILPLKALSFEELREEARRVLKKTGEITINMASRPNWRQELAKNEALYSVLLVLRDAKFSY
jgi:hypothetical protein